jgi:alpha/beta superfamily hydrolase
MAALFTGAVGALEVILDEPDRDPVGLAIVAHPQPLLGGNATHKIPQVLAKAIRDAGWRVARPNFRGVGGSVGAHDFGAGEAEDLLLLHGQLLQEHPGLRVALVGFSFGAYVQARVAKVLVATGTPPSHLCLAGMPAGDVEGSRHYDTPPDLPNALVIHGEMDERVRLQSVLDWARPHSQAITVVPGADHFFTGRLPVLRNIVLADLARGDFS